MLRCDRMVVAGYIRLMSSLVEAGMSGEARRGDHAYGRVLHREFEKSCSVVKTARWYSIRKLHAHWCSIRTRHGSTA